MFRHYLLISFRSIWQSKANSLINIFGLSIGIMCCLLIFLFVKDEWSYDTFHSKADRIFRVWVKEDWGENQQFLNVATPFPLAPTLKENFAEIEQQVRIHKIGSQVKVGEVHFSETLTVAGKDLFKVFDFEIVKGESDPLSDAKSVVLNESTAQRYFGTTDPIGKVLSVQLKETFEEFVVKAVVKDIPTNSSIRFYLLISDLNYSKLLSAEVITSQWFNVTPESYLLLKAGVDKAQLERKFPPLFRAVLGEENFTKSHYQAGLQPLTSIHLDKSFPAELASVSDPRYSYILGGISLLILIVGSINFITLSVASSLKRSKEVGVRKVAGATQKQLVIQFIGEALIITLISLVTGILLAIFAMPLFNDIAGKQLRIRPDLFMAVMCAALMFIIGVMAGSYPALVLSNLKPITVLKSKLPAAGRQQIRKAMVAVQLVLSILLISSTIVMKRQLTFLQTKNLGFDKEQLLSIQLNVPRGKRLSERIMLGFEKAEIFKRELSRLSQVEAVCGSSMDFANESWTELGYTDEQGTYRTFNLNIVDEDYFPTLKIPFASGRNFIRNNPADSRRSVIVNEAFVKEYGWNDAIGKRIPGKNFPDHEIVGVVKDFNFQSLYTKVRPVVMVMDPMIAMPGSENINIGYTPVPKVMIRLKPGDVPATIAAIEKVWDKLAADEEFIFRFTDQALNNQYQSDQNLGRIMSIATIIAISIVSLGLYALVSLTMQNRTREVTIRKVMGATEQSLLVLLSREYFFMVGIALVLSIPATLYLMLNWLHTFEYRIAVEWDVFILSGALSTMLAAVAICYQVVRTTLANPAKILRQE